MVTSSSEAPLSSRAVCGIILLVLLWIGGACAVFILLFDKYRAQLSAPSFSGDCKEITCQSNSISFSVGDFLRVQYAAPFSVMETIDVTSLATDAKEKEKEIRNSVEHLVNETYQDFESLEPFFDAKGYLDRVRIHKDGKPTPIRVLILLPGDEGSRSRRHLVQEIDHSGKCKGMLAPLSPPSATRPIHVIYYACEKPITI